MKKEQLKLSIACDLDAPFQMLLETFPDTIELYRNESKDEVEYAFPDAEMFGEFLGWACNNADMLPGDDASEELIESLNYWQDQMGGAEVSDQREIAENPNDPNMQAHEMAKQYVLSVGLPPLQPTPYVKIDPAVSKRIAAAFEAAESAPESPDVILAYDQFVLELDEQLKFVPVEIIPASQFGEYPYKTSKELVADVLNNNRMVVFDGGDDHAILSREENFKFRAVHDYFGHVATGFEFGPRGEENAWIEHSKMFTPLARQALTTDARGQNSWVNFGPHSHIPASERPYGEQKAAILPPWVQTHEVLEEAYAEYPDFYLGQLREVSEEISSIAASVGVGRNPEQTGLLFDVADEVAEKPKPKKKKASEKVELFKRKRYEVYTKVMDYFVAGEDGSNWYENTPKRIAEFFNNDPERTALFIGFLAATSPLRNIKQNVKLALKALKQFDAGAWLPPEYEKISEAEYDAVRKRNLAMSESGAKHGFEEVRATQKTIKKKKVMQYVRVHCPPRPRSEQLKTGFEYHDHKVILKLSKGIQAFEESGSPSGIPRDPAERAREYCAPRKSTAYQQMCCFRLGMPAHEPNAARIARGEALSGPKVTAFFNNLTLSADADNSVTVDTWMLKAFGFRKMNADGEKEGNAPTDPEYDVIAEAITELAAMGGMKPREFQAAVWVGVKRTHGDIARDTDEPFEVVLHREAEALARQDVFAFEEDEAKEIMAMREERRNPPDDVEMNPVRPAGTRNPDAELWRSHYGAWIAPDGKIYWVPNESHARVATKILAEKYGITDLDEYSDYGRAYDEFFDRGYIRIYSNAMTTNKYEVGYFGIELRSFEASKQVLKTALASLVKQMPSLRMSITEVGGTKYDYEKRKKFEEVASELFREAGGGWSEGVKKYHEWSSVGPMGSMRQGNNPPLSIAPKSPSVEAWAAHYGAWISPAGEIFWVGYQQHFSVALQIMGKQGFADPDEYDVFGGETDYYFQVLGLMLQHGFVRVVSGSVTHKNDPHVGFELHSLAESKAVLQVAFKALSQIAGMYVYYAEYHDPAAMLDDDPSSDTDPGEREDFEDSFENVFKAGTGGGWSEGVQKYHDWSSVGPMGSAFQKNPIARNYGKPGLASLEGEQIVLEVPEDQVPNFEEALSVYGKAYFEKEGEGEVFTNFIFGDGTQVIDFLGWLREPDNLDEVTSATGASAGEHADFKAMIEFFLKQLENKGAAHTAWHNPPISPTYNEWAGHYGAWLSPEGELIWVPVEGHVEAGRKILSERYGLELDADKVSPVYDAMFKHGYVRLLTGDTLLAHDEIGIDLTSFEASKEILSGVLRRLRKEAHNVEAIVTEFPQSDDSQYNSFHKPIGTLFTAGGGGWSEGVQKYHEWSSVGPMGSMRQGNNPAQAPSAEAFRENYGAWISPDGMVHWVENYGHAAKALSILEDEFNQQGLNRDEHYSIIYREMFNRGFVRLASGSDLRLWQQIGLDMESFNKSKLMLGEVFAKLTAEKPDTQVSLQEYPCRLNEHESGRSFTKSLGDIFSDTQPLESRQAAYDDPGEF